MNFDLDTKLSMVLCGPLNILGCHNIFEDEDDSATEIGADKRLAITRHYKRYKDGLDYLKHISNKAREVGMDSEFKELIARAIKRNASTVNPDNPLTFAEVHLLLLELQKTRFKDKLRNAADKLREQPSNTSKAAAKSITFLSQEASKHHSGANLHIKQLINNRNINPNEPINIRYTDENGKRAHIRISNKMGLLDQFKNLVYIIHITDNSDLSRKLEATYEAIDDVLEHYAPEMRPSQRKYTAGLYAIRNIADELAERTSKKKATGIGGMDVGEPEETADPDGIDLSGLD